MNHDPIATRARSSPCRWSLLVAVVLLAALVAPRDGAASEPIASQPGEVYLEPEEADCFDRTQCTYKLDRFEISDACKGAPGVEPVAGASQKFRARPLKSDVEFRGYNLDVRATGASTCSEFPLQVFILPRKKSAYDVAVLPQIPVDRGGGIEIDDARTTFDALNQTEPEDREDVRFDPTIWYFATPERLADSAEVTLPKIDASQKLACPATGPASAKVSFGPNQGERTISVVNDPKDCGTPAAASQVVIRLPSDALALERSPQAVPFTAPQLKDTELYLEPIETSDGSEAVGLRVVGGPLLRREDLREGNHNRFVDASSPRRGSWSTCNARSCLFVMKRRIALGRDDQNISVRLDTRATRMRKRTPHVYLPSSQPVDVTEGNLGAQSSWNLPSSRYSIPIATNPVRNRTEIPVPPVIARLLRDQWVLDCMQGTASLPKCAEFRAGAGNSGHLVLRTAEAANALVGADRQLVVKLEGLPLISITSDKQPVWLEIQTDTCEYGFEQVTPVIAGTKDVEVLYWVTAPKRCLCAPLKLKTATAEVTTSQDTDWLFPQQKECSTAPGRMLRLQLASVADATRSQALRLSVTAGSAADGAAVTLADGRSTFDLRVQRAVDFPSSRVAVEIGDGGREPTVLDNQPSLAVDRVNRLSIPWTNGVPWRVRLASRASHAPVPVSRFLRGAVLQASRDPFVLPWAQHEGKLLYFARGIDTNDTGLALVAELSGRVDELAEWPDAVPREARDFLAARPLRVGTAESTLANRKTQRFWMPWDLSTASLQCRAPTGQASPPPWNGSPIHAANAVRAMRRNEYRDCVVRIHLAPDSGMTAVPSTWGRQRIRMTVSKEEETTETDVATLREDMVKPDASVGELVIPVGDILAKYGKLEDYTALTFHLTHPADGALPEGLKGAYTPSTFERARASSVHLRTRLLPSLAWVVGERGPGDSHGLRAYATVTAGFSLVRTRNTGLDATTSSAYADGVGADFKYGILGVLEPWNFSGNKPVIPFLAPQLVAGVLGPTELNREEWWRRFSFVTGLNLRLPASSAPSGSGVEAQTGLVLWYELTGGGRDEAVHSLLFGINLNIGALTP